jgi:hypothetical protein
MVKIGSALAAGLGGALVGGLGEVADEKSPSKDTPTTPTSSASAGTGDAPYSIAYAIRKKIQDHARKAPTSPSTLNKPSDDATE